MTIGLIAASGIFSVSLSAQTPGEKGVVLTDSVQIHFRQNKFNIDTALSGNGSSLNRMLNHLTPRDGEAALEIKRLTVVGAASPEGGVEYNKYLSRKRAYTIFDYFKDRNVLHDSIADFKFLGRDWRGLKMLVEKTPEVPYRDEVLEILSKLPSTGEITARQSETALRSLKLLRGGKPYGWLYRNIFPQLRKSRLKVDYQLASKAVPVVIEPKENADSVVEPYVPVEPVSADTVVPEFKKPFYMSIRTNMLYDVLAVPNIGVDFYLGKNWSLGADWMYGWWKNDHTHRYWRLYGGEIVLRKWFGRAAKMKPLTGHHLGLYCGLLTYDFEWGGKGYMGGLPGHDLWDRCMRVAGVEYGYSLPISRRINFDFTIGVGVLDGKEEKYVPQDDHYVWQSTSRKTWVGPTKLEISLVWLIGHGNVNEKKGGRK